MTPDAESLVLSDQGSFTCPKIKPTAASPLPLSATDEPGRLSPFRALREPIMTSEFSFIMSLFTVAAAAGASVRLQAGNARQVSSNLHLAIAMADHALPGWLEPVLHPFYGKQSSLL